MPNHDAIIIGAGHNGLICAAYLAMAGVKTLVLERRHILGGACVTEDIPGAPGHRISTGAAQLGNLPPEIIRDLDLASHGYDFMLPDPLSVFVGPDGDALTIWQDPVRTSAAIRGIQTCGQALKVNCAVSRLPRFRGGRPAIPPSAP